MTETEAAVWWNTMSGVVADQMKVYTRPYANILAGAYNSGTGTFIEKEGVSLLTCEHVARLHPTAYYIDDDGSSSLEPGMWCVEPDENKDVAVAPIAAAEWSRMAKTAMPLSLAKFAQYHAPAPDELLFFRGIAGENVRYVSDLGVDADLSGYCSQEKRGTGNDNVFEMLWNPKETRITTGTSATVRERIKYDNPAGFSGSLIWNTRFVEMGCDITKWSPNCAVVTGLLRRFDDKTNTLLGWRVEHLLGWL